MYHMCCICATAIPLSPRLSEWQYLMWRMCRYCTYPRLLRHTIKGIQTVSVSPTNMINLLAKQTHSKIHWFAFHIHGTRSQGIPWIPMVSYDIPTFWQLNYAGTSVLVIAVYRQRMRKSRCHASCHLACVEFSGHPEHPEHPELGT